MTHQSTSTTNNTDDSSDIQMTLSHKEMLTCHRSSLVENMVPTTLFRHLVAMGTITSAEERRIRAKSTWEGMTSELLDHIMRKADAAFTNLSTALRLTCQDHLAVLLDRDMTKQCPNVMSLEHKHAILKSRVELSSDLTPDEVFNDLIVGRILLVSEVEEMKQQSTRELTNEILLDYVVRRSDQAFSVLTKSLDKTGQEHLAHLLRNRHSREESRRKLQPLGIFNKTDNDEANSAQLNDAYMASSQDQSTDSSSMFGQMLSPAKMMKRRHEPVGLNPCPPSPNQSAVGRISSPYQARLLKERAFTNSSYSPMCAPKETIHNQPLPGYLPSTPSMYVSREFVRAPCDSYSNYQAIAQDKNGVPSSILSKQNIVPSVDNLSTLLPHVDSEEESSKQCTLDDVSQQIVLMAENAYVNIQRADNSDESFRQFSTEMAQTTQNINKSLEVFRMIKEFCEDRKIDESAEQVAGPDG